MSFKAIIFIFLLPFYLVAQDNNEEKFDTAKRTDPFACIEDNFTGHRRFDIRHDSSMLYLQQYDRSRRDFTAVQNLGDVSTPFRDLRYKPFTKTGFISGFEPFNNLYFNIDSLRLYNTIQPYAEFSYAQGKDGGRGMIDFDALYTQNIGKRFNFSAVYHSASNDGFYLRQSLSCKNLGLNAWYHSKDLKYTLVLKMVWNKTNAMENGGMLQDNATDSLFRSLQPPTIRLVPVSLNNAKNINRNSSYEIKQNYRIGSLSSDSSKALYLGYVFSYTAQKNYYSDNAADYGLYDSVYYFNNLYSNDSFAFKSYKNAFELFVPFTGKGIGFSSGIEYSSIDVLQDAGGNNFNRFISHNSALYGKLNFKPASVFHLTAYGKYYPEGYNQHDYLLNSTAFIQHSALKNWNAKFEFLSNRHHAFFRQDRMFSNHYRWTNNLSPVSYQSLSAQLIRRSNKSRSNGAFTYTLPKNAADVSVNYILTDRYIYLNTEGNPQQGSKGQSCLQFTGNFHLNLKYFQWHQELVLQKFSAGLENQVQLPELLSKSSLYFQKYAFKKASFLQMGVDVFFTSAYKASFYNPALQNFVINNKQIGAYPVMDFFINAEVKTARIFFKVEHFNQDLILKSLNENYMYASPYQPYAPRRFRLGFNWKFYY